MCLIKLIFRIQSLCHSLTHVITLSKSVLIANMKYNMIGYVSCVCFFVVLFFLVCKRKPVSDISILEKLLFMCVHLLVWVRVSELSRQLISSSMRNLVRTFRSYNCRHTHIQMAQNGAYTYFSRRPVFRLLLLFINFDWMGNGCWVCAWFNSPNRWMSSGRTHFIKIQLFFIIHLFITFLFQLMLMMILGLIIIIILFLFNLPSNQHCCLSHLCL